MVKAFKDPQILNLRFQYALKVLLDAENAHSYRLDKLRLKHTSSFKLIPSFLGIS